MEQGLQNKDRRQKIYIAGVWGIGNINIMNQFQDDEEVVFLKMIFSILSCLGNYGGSLIAGWGNMVKV